MEERKEEDKFLRVRHMSVPRTIRNHSDSDNYDNKRENKVRHSDAAWLAAYLGAAVVALPCRAWPQSTSEQAQTGKECTWRHCGCR